MEEKRAKTYACVAFYLSSASMLTQWTSLEALSTFIESQKTLLTRTQADIGRLNTLRNEIADEPEDTCSIVMFGNKVRGTEPWKQSRTS